MPTKELRPGIYAVGSLDRDRKLFDELIPLPDGTTYNAYLIKGSEKTALIDTVDPAKAEELFSNLKKAGITQLDYVISNHAEQDHSGSIPHVLKAFPEAMVVTNLKCKDFLKSLLMIPEEKFITRGDHEILSLGDRTLEFLIAPWVHWPETMLTYLKEDGILFSCDLFGAHLATSDLFADDDARVYESAKRYYAEIMMPFRSNIVSHLRKLQSYDIKMIAPSHGPVHAKSPFIVDAYADWVSDNVKNEVVLPFVSMHGSTRAMVDHFIDALMKRSITVKPFNMPRTDIGELAIALVDAATIILAAPTVLVGPHPTVAYAAFLANALRPKTRFASVIGSFGWGTQVIERLGGLMTNLKVEMIEPVVIKGYPTVDDLKKLDLLADAVLAKHKAAGIGI
ncbi:MAG TPA: FprA family A-type flavoprotein [bacterium]